MIPHMEHFQQPGSHDPHAPAQSMIRSALAVEAMTPNQTLPAKVLSAWRIVRTLAYLTNRIMGDQPLSDIDLAADHTYPRYTTPGPLAKALNDGLRLNDPHGLPLFPPTKKALFVAWKRAAYEIIDLRSLREGAMMHPQLGRIGLRALGLLDEDAFLLKPVDFPTPQSILSMERHLIIEGQTALIEQTSLKAPLQLVEKYGLSHEEARQVIELSRHTAANIENDPEVDLGLMILKVEDHIARCRQNFDLRGENMSLRLLAQIKGLTKDTDDMTMRDMVKTVENISRQRKQLESEERDIPTQ